jgi:hypothetical protein
VTLYPVSSAVDPVLVSLALSASLVLAHRPFMC